MAATEIEALVLRRVPYSDTRSVLTVWSRQKGRLSLAVADGGAGKSAVRMRALCQPASLIGCLVDIRPGRDVHTARNFQPLDPLPSLRANPLKGLIGIFMADVLLALLRETDIPQEATWAFISGAVKLLDAESDPKSVANFPLWLLLKLAVVMGVSPEGADWADGKVFDLAQGRFADFPSDAAPGRWLTPAESRALALLLRMDSTNLGAFRLTTAERQQALDIALRYLSSFFPTLLPLRSLDTLRAILH